MGLLYQITDTLKFGASYRSQIGHSITNGNVKFSPEGVNNFNNTGGSSSINLPAIGYLGLSWAPKPFTFEFDMQYTDWGSYNRLKLTFDEPLGGRVDSLDREKDWHAVWAYRVGVQYTVTEWLDLRAGYIYDPSPIPNRTLDPLVPSGNRNLYCLGFGLNFEKFTFDFAYNYLDDESRKFDNEVGEAPNDLLVGAGAPPMARMTGKFEDVDAHIFGINLTYKF